VRVGRHAVTRVWRGMAAAVLLALPAESSAQVLGENVGRFRAGRLDVTVRYREDRLRQLEGQLRQVLTGAVERYSELFGGPPRSADGEPLATLTLRVASDPMGGGDTAPGVIALLVARQPLFGFYDWRMTLLHEAFHLWSGGTFRHAGPSELWFNEGAAEFYAMQTAARLGFTDDVTAIRNAATLVGFYAGAVDQHRMSLVEASQNRDQHHFLVHHGGFTAVLLLDHDLRTRTGSAKSMDDVMRWLYGNFNSGRRYSTLDVVRGIQAATGQDAAEFFARHVMGRLPLPVSASVNLGELSRNVLVRRAGGGGAITGVSAPDPALLQSLGLAAERK